MGPEWTLASQSLVLISWLVVRVGFFPLHSCRDELSSSKAQRMEPSGLELDRPAKLSLSFSYINCFKYCVIAAKTDQYRDP